MKKRKKERKGKEKVIPSVNTRSNKQIRNKDKLEHGAAWSQAWALRNCEDLRPGQKIRHYLCEMVDVAWSRDPTRCCGH